MVHFNTCIQKMSKLTLALVGKTGHGKSSTGNTILKKDSAFENDLRISSKTKLLAHRQNHVVEIYDIQGLMDPTQEDTEDKIIFINNIDQIMKNSGAIDAFIIVLKFNVKFTKEENRTIQLLEEVLGNTFLKNHGMIVLTHGDNFDLELSSGDDPGVILEKWCEDQGAKFKDLLEKVEGRKILVYNKGDPSKINESSEKILRMAEKLKEKGPYSLETHNRVKREIEAKKPPYSSCNIF
ncbi:hypothetical protein Btru_049454 [Bulinus truncatus]|nr:hypothetical protein Btru_049454 [Bulinus truncatus]